MSTRKQWTRGAALAGLLMACAASATAATLCVNPLGSGGCYTTIQAAVTAAAPFDTVKVGAGTYRGGVSVVGRDGLQIVGASKTSTIIDPGADTPGGYAGDLFGISIASQNVQVKNLMVRNGAHAGIQTVGNGTIIQGVNVTGADVVAIYILGGWNAQISQSEVHDALYAIYTTGFGTLVKNNTVSNNIYGVYLEGADGGQILSNRIVNNETGVYAVNSGVDGANGLVVKSNDIRHAAGTAVYVSGGSPTIVSNKVFGAGIGIVADCTSCFGGSVASNTITDTKSYGLLAMSDGPGLSLVKNILTRTGMGVSLNSPSAGIFATGNKARDVGLDQNASCFESFGDNNNFTSNTAATCTKAGFYVTGNSNTLTSNRATGTFENGFTIDGNKGTLGGSLLYKNKATLDAAQGFAIIGGAFSTTLRLNSASKNRVDFCNQGSGTILSGNTFGTTAATCDIAH